jgi:hypothetical protein
VPTERAGFWQSRYPPGDEGLHACVAAPAYLNGLLTERAVASDCPLHDYSSGGPWLGPDGAEIYATEIAVDSDVPCCVALGSIVDSADLQRLRVAEQRPL